DDKPVNQRVAAKMLERFGCGVAIASDGREAVEKVSMCKYDLVLMDCQMPEMDGYEATGLIRKLEKGAGHIPIVAMTAHAMKGDREKCLEAGMDDYITKPLRTNVLQDALDHWVKPRPHWDGGRKVVEKQSREAGATEFLARLREIAGDDESFVQEMVLIFIDQ